MMKISCSATWGTSRPLSVLTDLLAMRQKWFKESAEDAVIATAIDVLGSLRALTRSAKNRRSTHPGIEECPGLRPGYYGGKSSPKRTLRLAAGGGRFVAGRVKWLTGNVKDRDLRVFKVVSEHEKVKPYYVVAHSAAEVKKFENAAAGHRMREYGLLAKWAFGVAMNKLSTRNVHDNVTGEARLAGSRLSKVWKAKLGDAFAVRVCDELDYATDALQGGSSAVDIAVMKASNKIAGRLQHRFGDLLGSDFTTPFPEVRSRR